MKEKWKGKRYKKNFTEKKNTKYEGGKIVHNTRYFHMYFFIPVRI